MTSDTTSTDDHKPTSSRSSTSDKHDKAKERARRESKNNNKRSSNAHSVSGASYERSPGDASVRRKTSRTESGSSNHSRSRHRHNHGSDKSKTRTRRHDEKKGHRNSGANAPDAAGAALSSSERSNLSSSERSRQEKKKGHRNSGPTSPGAVLSSSERSNREKKKSNRNSGAITPGAVLVSTSERSNLSSSERSNREEKKRRSNTGTRSPGATSERSSHDHHARRRTKGHHHSSSSIWKSRTETSSTNVLEEDGQEVKLANEGEETRVQKMVQEQQPARLREEEHVLEEAERKNKKKNRNHILVIVLVIVVLIGGGAAAYFALRNKSSNDGSNTGDGVGKGVIPNSTMAPISIPPTNSPTDSPTNAPTELVKYDPPSPEDCKMLADGLQPPGTENITDIRDFSVDVDVGLALVVEMNVILPEVEQSVKEWLLLPLVGCPVDSQERRILMPDNDDKEGSSAGMNTIRGGGGSGIVMAQGNLEIRRHLVNIRYMIADVEVQVIDREESCTSPSSSEQCNIFGIKLSLKLRGDEKNFEVRVLLADFFPIDQDLHGEIGLASDVIDSFIVRGVRSNDPTSSPSDFPSAEPSVLSITDIPTTTKSANPSFMPVLSPVTLEPTRTLTVAPTTAPSKAPSKAPTPAPNTVAPTPTPPPTAAPAPGDTPNPTKTPTKNPTKNPTLGPSSAPSQSPSDNPSSFPSGGPTTSPSSGPTSSPTSEPTNSPTSRPTSSPTSGPTSSPTSNYRGCWKDNAGSAMEYLLSTKLKTSNCLGFCGRMGYQYAGRSVDHCYCGNQYDSLGESGGCQTSTTPFDGATHQSGSDASSIAVYSTDADGTLTTLEDNLYCGCVQDTSRTLSESSLWYTHPMGCIQACKGLGHSFAGLKEGRKCFCGDSIDVEPSFDCSTECDITGYCYGDVVSGDGSCKCGAGNNKFTLFRTSSSVSCPEAGVLTSDYASAYFDIDDPAWPAENGIDGNTDSFTLTDHQIKPSVYTVELGFYASISKLVVMTRNTHAPCPTGASCGYGPGDKVELLDGSRNVISNTERVLSDLVNGIEVDTNTFTYSGVTGARFVRIHIDIAVHLQVVELQAEGVVNDITGTIAPTMSPSTAPPTADGPKYWLGCGKRNFPESHVAILSEEGYHHEDSTVINGYPISARCCSSTEIAGWNKRNSACPWAQSELNGICRKYVDYATANAICASAGGRLCTKTEIESFCLRSSGCQYDWYTLAWSSDPSPQ